MAENTAAARLIEREEELALLEGLLSDAAAGRGRTALVTGPTATGKSTLLAALTDRAHAAGATVLTAVGSADETALPLALVGQLLHSAPADGPGRGESLRLLADPAAALLMDYRPSVPLSAATGPLVQALYAALLEPGDGGPLVLVVDDVHQADPASLAVLACLVRRARRTPVLAAFGHSDEHPYRDGGFRTTLQRLPDCHRITLSGLGPDGVRAMARDLLGDAFRALPDPDALVAECLAVGGGNPLLTRALLTNEPLADGLPVGEAYGRAVLGCLHRARPEALRVAHGLAVLERPERLHRLLGLGPALVEQALAELDSAGLTRDGRLRHPAARSALLLDLEPAARADLHRAAAELARADGEPATTVAPHLLAAGAAATPAADSGAGGTAAWPRWAVGVLEEAALKALAEGEVTSAVDYLLLACHGCADEEWQARLRMTLVRAEWRVNPGAQLPHLDELAEALRRGLLPGRDALVLAKALLWHGRLEDAREVLTLLAASTAPVDALTAAELRTTLPWLRCSFAPVFEQAAGLDPDPDRPAPPTTRIDVRLKAATALDSVLTHGPSEQVVAEAERILRSTRLNELGMDTAESALLALTYADSAGRAAPWCDGLLDDSLSRQAPSRQARLAVIRSEICFRQGDLRGAEAQARRALGLLPADAWGVTVGQPLGGLLLALTARGRLEHGWEELARPVPDAMLQSRFGLHYLQARGRFKIATGHLDAAVDDLRVCGELMRSWGLDAPGLISWRTDLAEALLLLGEREEARTLLEEQLARTGEHSPRAHGMALRRLAGSFELRQRPSLLRRAAEQLRLSGDRYEWALALTDLTQAYQALGEPRRARLIGRQAVGLAAACGAEALTRLLADHGAAEPAEPDTAVAIRADFAQLSDSERRVAELAAQGYSNREISARLYVTLSTVEQHLTRAYRKLGMTSRAQLTTAMADLAELTDVSDLADPHAAVGQAGPVESRH